MKKIAVLIADDHPMVREAIKIILRKNSQINFCGEADNGIESIKLIEKFIPDVAIIDLEMPKMNGYDTILELHTKYPEIKTIAFSGFLDLASQKRAISMGAFATISKSEVPDVFIKAFEAVIEGKNFHSKVSSNFHIEALKHNKYSLLTLREQQILNLIAEGKTSKEIGHIHNISQWTVDKHRSNIKIKLEIKNLAEMIRYAIENSEVPSC